MNLPSGGYLSQLVVTVGKFQGGNDGTLGSPFQTGGGPMCLVEQTSAAAWSAPVSGYQGFGVASQVFQDAHAKGKKSKYEFTLVAIYCDGASPSPTFREYGCDPEIDVDNGNG